MTIDATHALTLESWVGSANGHPDFPIQNLPLGVFSPPGGSPRAGIAIGEQVLDLAAVQEAGLLGVGAEAAGPWAAPALNALLALGAGPRRALRARLSALLATDAPAAIQAQLAPALHQAADCTLHLPAQVGDYTDFFAGITHAINAGRMFRPDQPLVPNYKYVPIGYHGRASSVQASGMAVRRPNGQRKRPDEAAPSFGPCRNLDYELEMGVWIGPGNSLGTPIPVAQASAHIAGFCLLNDWSARDVQGWESQPLGPFLAKSFATTLSPWIITPEALAPFRVAQKPRPDGDPAPLPYLADAADQAGGALDVALQALLRTARMRAENAAPVVLTRSNATDLYWTVAQMVAHHSSGGCNLMPGDLLGTGTISAPAADGSASLLEITEGGRKPITLPNGETRRFLEDGDEIIFTGRASREGAVSIGFGECRGQVLPAPDYV